MNDMTSVIVPKSDQINADDLIGRTMTITIREVQIKGGQEQPVSILFDGSDKAFRPCKSMSRVLVAAWGPDAKVYVGRSLTLYRDPAVKWGGLEVGGIRISHMTHLDGPMTMALTATKGSRKPYTVKPLAAPADDGLAAARAAIANAPTIEALKTTWSSKAMGPYRDRLQAELDARKAELSFEGPADSQRGDATTLAQAKDEIDAADDAEEVNRLALALSAELGDDEAADLRAHAAARCETLLGAPQHG